MKLKKQLITPRLLIIVKSIDGGTGTFLLNFLKANKLLSNKRISISILGLEHPSYMKFDSRDFTFFRDADYYPEKYSLSPKNLIDQVRELTWIKKNIQIFRPNIVLGIDMRCNILAIATKLFVNSKIITVATTHIDLTSTTLKKSNRIIGYLLKFVIRIFYEKADSLICISKGLSKHLKEDFGISKPIQTIYYGGNFKKVRLKQLVLRKKKIIVSVARLSAQKDYDNLIKSVFLLNKKYTNFELWIAGDGPEKKHLSKLVKKLNLTKKIKFLGWINNVEDLYKKCDIFILSSKFEGLGYVLIEAMSNGLPVISTDSPYGPSEILGKGKYGHLVPVGNAEQMQKSLFQLLSNKSEYKEFSLRSLERCKFFSERRMFDSYSKIFTSLINGQK
jgi:glycosyltransferase involved in cell wall biosynthesis